MKALSIWQPWAWLIVKGFKPIENRSWYTPYRGQLLIHASKKYDPDFNYEWASELIGQPMPPRAFFDNQLGGIVGCALLTDCVHQHSSPWFFGTHGFVLDRARELPFFPARGYQGFFNVDYPFENMKP